MSQNEWYPETEPEQKDWNFCGTTMEKRSNRASGGEMEDEVKAIVNATSHKWQHIWMANMANSSNLIQELLLFPFISHSFCDPLHSNFLITFQNSSVHLCISSFSNQIL